MKNSTAARKPLILPPEIVQVLRGERGYTEESKDIAELAISIYQAGHAGRAYEVPRVPDFPYWTVEETDHFLWACWRYGRAQCIGVVVQP